MDSLPNPAVSADIRITLTPCSKTWALPTTAVTLGTVTATEPILATLGAPASKFPSEFHHMRAPSLILKQMLKNVKARNTSNFIRLLVIRPLKIMCQVLQAPVFSEFVSAILETKECGRCLPTVLLTACAVK